MEVVTNIASVLRPHVWIMLASTLLSARRNTHQGHLNNSSVDQQPQEREVACMRKSKRFIFQCMKYPYDLLKVQSSLPLFFADLLPSSLPWTCCTILHLTHSFAVDPPKMM